MCGSALVLFACDSVRFMSVKAMSHNGALESQIPIGAEKYVTEILMEGKKIEQIKGLISNMWLFFLVYNTTHHYQALYQISEI